MKVCCNTYISNRRICIFFYVSMLQKLTLTLCNLWLCHIFVFYAQWLLVGFLYNIIKETRTTKPAPVSFFDWSNMCSKSVACGFLSMHLIRSYAFWTTVGYFHCSIYKHSCQKCTICLFSIDRYVLLDDIC